MSDSSRTLGRERTRQAGKKGGEATARRHGPDHFVALGKKGGARTRELIARGKAAEARGE
jgi:general stress protein YciG